MRHRYIWIGLFFVYLCGGVIFSLVQPLGLAPDEAAHVRYIKYMARTGSVPVWQSLGGGEAGYESQHPPLGYALGAVVYRASNGLPENWRWQLLRWCSLLVGCALFWVARGLLLDYFYGRIEPAAMALAAVSLTPLVLEYSSYPNPDIMSALWSTLGFWMALRVARGQAGMADRVLLGVAFGLGLLTKLTALGIVPVILTAYLLEPVGDGPERRRMRRLHIGLTFLGAAVIAGGWYFRNSLLYRTPFPHTISEVPSGLSMSKSLGGTWRFVCLTVRNTFESTWVERGWMPPGVLAPVLYTVIIGLILLAAVIAVSRRKHTRKQSIPNDPAHWLGGVFLVGLFVSHQYQVWFVDFAFNAGGRYLMNGVAVAHGLVIVSLSGSSRGRMLCWIWVATMLAMDVACLLYLIIHVNASVVPGWHLMKLTVPY